MGNKSDPGDGHITHPAWYLQTAHVGAVPPTADPRATAVATEGAAWVVVMVAARQRPRPQRRGEPE